MTEDETGRRPERCFRSIIVATYVVVLAFSFGGALEDPFPTSDDHAWLYQLKRHTYAENPMVPSSGFEDFARRSLWDQTLACWTEAALAGHFQPVVRVFWIWQYALVGDDGWMRFALLTAQILHLLSAVLLALILRRAGSSRLCSYLAGLIFLLHPVAAIALTGVNGSIRVYPLFFTMVAIFFWYRSARGMPRRSLHLGLATLAVLAAVNAGPIFLAITPLLLAVVAVVEQLRLRESFRPWARDLVLRFIPITIAVLTSIWIRQVCYGTVSSRVGRATTRAQGLPFWKGLPQQFLGLREAPDIHERAHEHIGLPAGHAASFLSWLALAVVVAVAAWAVYRSLRRRERSPDEGRGAVLLATLLGIGFLTVSCATFLLVTGEKYLHRYLYVALPGIGILWAVAIQIVVAVLRRVVGRTAAVLGALGLVAATLVSFGIANAESLADVRYAYRASRVTVDSIVSLMDDDPELRRVFVLDLPKSMGRAGILFQRDTALSKGIDLGRWRATGACVEPFALGKGDGIFHESELIERWDELAGDETERRRTGVVHFDREAIAVRPVRGVVNPESRSFPGPVTFGAFEDATTAGSRFEYRSCIDAVTRYRFGRLPGAILRARRIVLEKPDTAREELARVARDHGRDCESILVELVQSGPMVVRDAAAEELAKLWRLDDMDAVPVQADGPWADRARALGRVLAIRDLPQSWCAAGPGTEMAALEYLLERSIRGDDLRDAARRLISRSGEIDSLVAAALAWSNDPCGLQEMQAAILAADSPLHVRLECAASLQALHEPVVLAVIDDLAASRPDDVALWSALSRRLRPDRAGWPTTRLVLRGLQREGLSSATRRLFAEAWTKMGGDGHAAAALRRLETFEDISERFDDRDAGAARAARAELRRLLPFVTAAPMVIPEFWSVYAQACLLAGDDLEQVGRELQGRLPSGSAVDRLRLAEQIPALAAGPEAGSSIAVATCFARAARERVAIGEEILLAIAVTNDGEVFIPGGPGPLTPRIELYLRRGYRSSSIIRCERRLTLPLAGLAPGETTTFVVSVRLPALVGEYEIGAVPARDRPADPKAAAASSVRVRAD